MPEKESAVAASWPHERDFYPAGARATLEYRLSTRLIITARRWTTLIDGILKAETGQNRARWQTLFAIAFSEGQVTTLTLSTRLNVRWPTLVRTLGSLERDKLIRRLPHPSDGRSRLVQLTEDGYAMLSRIQPIMDATRSKVLDGLTDQQLTEVSDRLDEIIVKVAAMPQQELADEDDAD